MKKILSRQTILIGILIASTLSLVLFLSLPQLDESVAVIPGTNTLANQAQAFSEPKTPSFGLPMRLRIPKINVDSVVEHVGLTSDGAMDAPKERADVAWFNLGARPGNNGAAVISGHYGWQNLRGSVFDDLHKLHTGDKVYVEDDRGEIITFVVREVRRYDPANQKTDGSEIFGSFDGRPHLNLITCEGVWDENTQQYTKRLVVFTDLEV